ncbi:hypothetical protein, partial [Zooshikella harenae]
LEEADKLLIQVCNALDEEHYASDEYYDSENFHFYTAVYNTLYPEIFMKVAKKAADLDSVQGTYLYGKHLCEKAFKMDKRTKKYKETLKEAVHYLRLGVYKGCIHSITWIVGDEKYFTSRAEQYALSIPYYEYENIDDYDDFPGLTAEEKQEGLALYNDLKEKGFETIDYYINDSVMY